MAICGSRPTGRKRPSFFYWPAAEAGKRLLVSREGCTLLPRHLRHRSETRILLPPDFSHPILFLATSPFTEKNQIALERMAIYVQDIPVFRSIAASIYSQRIVFQNARWQCFLMLHNVVTACFTSLIIYINRIKSNECYATFFARYSELQIIGIHGSTKKARRLFRATGDFSSNWISLSEWREFPYHAKRRRPDDSKARIQSLGYFIDIPPTKVKKRCREEGKLIFFFSCEVFNIAIVKLSIL